MRLLIDRVLLELALSPKLLLELALSPKVLRELALSPKVLLEPALLRWAALGVRRPEIERLLSLATGLKLLLESVRSDIGMGAAPVLLFSTLSAPATDVDILERLRGLGERVRLFIDDIGTGCATVLRESGVPI